VLDVVDETRVGHASDAAQVADAHLLRRDDVHDDAAAQRLGEANVDGELVLLGGLEEDGAVVATTVQGNHTAAVAVGGCEGEGLTGEVGVGLTVRVQCGGVVGEGGGGEEVTVVVVHAAPTKIQWFNQCYSPLNYCLIYHIECQINFDIYVTIQRQVLPSYFSIIVLTKD
jgi:hypothetical protein